MTPKVVILTIETFFQYRPTDWKGLPGFPLSGWWKPTNLTTVFTLRTSIFLASWYYAEGIYIDVKYGCSWILDGLVSSHPTLS
jgi:hypothetical protein